MGLARSRLVRIGSALADTTPADLSPDQIHDLWVRTVVWRTNDVGRIISAREFSRNLAENIKAAASRASAIVIDMSYSFPEVKGKQYPEGAIRDGLAMAAKELGQSKTVVLHAGGFTPIDEFVEYIESALKAHVVLVNTATGKLGQSGDALSWTVSDELEASFKEDLEDHRSQLADRVVRRRGVFKSRNEATHDAFRYSAEPGRFEVEALLSSYFRSRKIKLVIHDDSVEPWLREAIAAAAVRASAELISGGSLLESAEGELEGVEGVQLPESSKDVCIIVPMFKSGQTARRLLDAAELRGVLAPRVLAILAKDAGVSPRGGLYSFRPPLRQPPIQVNYFVPVKHVRLDKDAWQMEYVRARTQDKEVPSDRWSFPSQVGMLSLFSELGASAETNVPSWRSAAIEWFPAMNRLEDKQYRQDALWLAECLIRVCTSVIGCERSELLVVVPRDSGNGTRPIANAIKNHLDVEVVSVPRSLDLNLNDDGSIDGLPEEDRIRIVDHASSNIVLVDESTVSYSTLSYLEAIVRNIGLGDVALSAVAVEAIVDEFEKERPRHLHSLYRWRPTSFVKVPDGAS